MILYILTFILCLLFFVICYLGTGSDLKNIKSLASYPDEVIELIKNDSNYHISYKKTNEFLKFISNFIMFLIIIFIFGIFIRSKNYLDNFLQLLFMGEILNLFDLLVIDILWWRNSKRVRFKDYQDKKLYMPIKKHLISFVKALFMFAAVAAIDGFLLTLF